MRLLPECAAWETDMQMLQVKAKQFQYFAAEKMEQIAGMPTNIVLEQLKTIISIY